MKRSLVFTAAILALAACRDGSLPTAPTAASFGREVASSGGGGAVNTKAPYRSFAFNPCSRETIEFQGTIHIVVVASPTGGHTVSHANLQGVSGRGLVTGNKYQMVQTTNTVNNAGGRGATTFTSVLVFRVIAQGPIPDWYATVIMHVTVNANGEPTAQVAHTDGGCRG